MNTRFQNQLMDTEDKLQVVLDGIWFTAYAISVVFLTLYVNHAINVQ